jgi:hypothetical protein
MPVTARTGSDLAGQYSWSEEHYLWSLLWCAGRCYAEDQQDMLYVEESLLGTREPGRLGMSQAMDGIHFRR